MFIVFESSDASGKGLQAEKLRDALHDAGRRVELFSFPRYSETASGEYVGAFLRGEFGELGKVHPVLAAALFAADRIESRDELVDAIESSDLVIADRYTVSNFVHQAVKLPPDEVPDFKYWLDSVEGSLPKPDLTIHFKTNIEVTKQLLAKKKGRSYTDGLDIQESDLDYLQKVINLYDTWTAHANYKTVTVDIRNEVGDGPRDPDEIHSEILHVIGGFCDWDGSLDD